MKKKIISLLLVLSIVVLNVSAVSAYITGYDGETLQTGYGEAGCELQVSKFWDDPGRFIHAYTFMIDNKSVPRIRSSLSVCYYYSGKQIFSDSVTEYNKQSAYCVYDFSSADYNTRSTGYGAHSVIGNTSWGCYTQVIGVS